MKWKNGFYFDSEAPEGAVDIEEKQYEELMWGQAAGLTIEEVEGYPVLIDHRPSEAEISSNNLRARRSAECFPVVNRGQLWYERLSPEQKTELDDWYSAWLDTPETGIVPEKPSWLEEKL